MNNPWLIAIVSIVACFAIYWFVFRKKKAKVYPLTAPGIVLPVTMIGHNRTDGGMFFTGGNLDDAIRLTIGGIIIDALADMIAASQYHNPSWTLGKTTGEYKVFFIPPMATNMDGSPALLVAGVQTAGTVINTDPNVRPTEPQIVLPEQANWNFLEYLKNSVHNEGEHAREWLNDLNIFLSFTGANDIHPHWSPPPGGNA